MHEENERSENAALNKLRRKLGDGLARRRWTKTQLARQAELGRTTVSETFQDGGPVPSEQTVAALSHALRLDVEELLDLRRSAAASTTQAAIGDAGLGRPIGQWDPHDLEVHPAGPVLPAARMTDLPGARMLPGYVQREHDQVLVQAVTEAASGSSRMVVLVGSSSTGKTRACWEAVQPLAARGWRLWHPFDPSRAEAALDALHRVGPRTVVWLNEAQHYLGDREHGERIAAALHHLLVTPEFGPVLVLGTLWPEYAHQYRALPSPGAPDPHSRARELLAGRTLTVPEAFDASALATAAELAQRGDTLLADALTRADEHGRLTQDLAGAPELLHQLHTATPPARALLEAAMDARRLGVGLHLPKTFLTDAAVDYLTDAEYDDLPAAWAEHAYAELTRPVHGKQSALRTTTPRPTRRPIPPTEPGTSSPPPAEPTARLADYLEQHGRTTRSHLCPPASFWHAAHTHLTHPDDLHNLTLAASARLRLQWAHYLRHRAADRGSANALIELARMRKDAGDREGAESLYLKAANQGRSFALSELARMKEEAGDLRSAEALYLAATGYGHLSAITMLQNGIRGLKDAETCRGSFSDGGDLSALFELVRIKARVGDLGGIEAIYQEAAAQGDFSALRALAYMKEEAGDLQGAEALYQEIAGQGQSFAVLLLALAKEQRGDLQNAAALYQEAADQGQSFGLLALARLKARSEDLEGAELLYREAIDRGNTLAVLELIEVKEAIGELEEIEGIHREAIGRGEVSVLLALAYRKVKAGDLHRAEILYRQAIDAGHPHALRELAEIKEDAEGLQGAIDLYRQAADRGAFSTEEGDWRRFWPYGLDPDGTPTPPWTLS
ncbi:hypothetical protein [Streptomyces hydrogenans]|uniref:hypothetical protein n=1 Tax=Streptomyces hydrogenans TaxID=1873719 RepID=UPI0036A0B9DF